MEFVILSAAVVSSFGMALAFERAVLRVLFRLLEHRAAH